MGLFKFKSIYNKILIVIFCLYFTMNLTFVKNLTNLVVTNTAVGCVMDEVATNDNDSSNNDTQPTAAIDDHGGVLLDDKQIK